MAQKKKIVVTEADFNGTFDALKALIIVVVGKETGRPRFRGFRILDNVKNYVAKAMEFFTAGSFEHAVRELGNARECIVNTERAYARNSIDKFFLPLIDPERIGKLDPDLNESIGKRFVEYQEIIGVMVSSRDTDMNEVSRRYWALLDRINSAPREQAARVENRNRKADQRYLKSKKEEADQRRRVQTERDQAARLAQAEADERGCKARSARAEELTDEFSSMF